MSHDPKYRSGKTADLDRKIATGSYGIFSKKGYPGGTAEVARMLNERAAISAASSMRAAADRAKKKA